MAALCLHLDHGVWSMFQTLGLNNARINAALRILSRVVALVVFAGFIAVPVAVLAGWLALKECVMLDAKIPAGPIEQKWDRCRFDMKLVSPRQPAEVSRSGRRLGAGGCRRGGHARRAGLPGATASRSTTARAAPTRSPPRAGSTPPRTTATTATASTACSTTPSRGATSAPARPTPTGWRSSASRSSTSASPRACRSPGNTADCSTTRSFGGVQVERTFYARGQTGQQLLLGAYQALERQIAAGSVTMHPHTEMLDLVVVNGKARGIVTRNLRTGAVRSYPADAVVLATGGYGNVFYLSTNAKASNCHRHLAGLSPRRDVRQPVLHPDPPHVHPGHGRAPVEADADVGVAPQRRPRLGAHARRATPAGPTTSRKASAITTWSGATRASATSCPATWPRAPPRRSATPAAASGRAATGSISTSATPSAGMGLEQVQEKYGNLFEIYERITGEDGYQVPMRIYPAVHYTMGGLWVDYHLMSTIPGLFVGGEANFSDQGANRLGASALMQGLADGYFILPATVPNYLASTKLDAVDTSHPAFREAEAEVRRRIDRAAGGQGPAHGRLDPPRAGQAHVGRMRHGPLGSRPAAGPRPDPRAPGGVPDQRPRARGPTAS